MSAGRPRLNRDRVLDEAVALADRDGPEALTVRRLADALDVHPTSLYNHVPSKQAVLDGVVERLFDEAGLADDVATWQDWVRELAAALRRVARAHPGAFMVLTRRAADTPNALRQTEAGLAAFARGGFPLGECATAVRAISLALLGLALNECPATGEWAEAAPPEPDLRPYALLSQAAELPEADDPDAHWDALVDALLVGWSARAPRTTRTER